MLRSLLDPSKKHGAFHQNEKAEPFPREKLHLTVEGEKIVWDHLVESVSI